MPPLNIEAVRAAYYEPGPGSPPTHISTREERLAEYERLAVRWCLERGGDPVAERLGEHEQLVGGPSKPLRPRARNFLDSVPIEPMPTEWFSYPAAHIRYGGDKVLRNFLLLALGSHFAGNALKPSVETMARWLRDPDPPPLGRHLMRTLFESLRPYERWRLPFSGGTILELSRATHLSGTRYARHIDWLNRFAINPGVWEKTTRSPSGSDD